MGLLAHAKSTRSLNDDVPSLPPSFLPLARSYPAPASQPAPRHVFDYTASPGLVRPTPVQPRPRYINSKNSGKRLYERIAASCTRRYWIKFDKRRRFERISAATQRGTTEIQIWDNNRTDQNIRTLYGIQNNMKTDQI